MISLFCTLLNKKTLATPIVDMASFFRVIRIKSVISSKITMTLGHVIELNQNFKLKILFFRMNSKAAI